MSPTTPELEATDDVTTAANGSSAHRGESNGYPRNGFSGETVEAVREATEKFFIQNLKLTPTEAKQRTELVTAGWAIDLELAEK